MIDCTKETKELNKYRNIEIQICMKKYIKNECHQSAKRICFRTFEGAMGSGFRFFSLPSGFQGLRFRIQGSTVTYLAF